MKGKRWISIRDFYLKGKWKYYELAENLKEIKENLKKPNVRKLAPFALSVPPAIVVQGVMPSIAKSEETLESLKAKVEAEIKNDKSGQFKQILDEAFEEAGEGKEALAYEVVLHLFEKIKEAREIANEYYGDLDEKKSVKENADFLYEKIKKKMKGSEGEDLEAALRTAYLYTSIFYLENKLIGKEELVKEINSWYSERVGEVSAKYTEETNKNKEEIAKNKEAIRQNNIVTKIMIDVVLPNYVKIDLLEDKRKRDYFLKENTETLKKMKELYPMGYSEFIYGMIFIRGPLEHKSPRHHFR